MHGATLLDARDAVLRPAILWNDGRSAAECAALERAVPASRAITGNLAMPGFTAPKLLWVRAHEPDVFARVRRVLLPKDWLRLRMTGDAATDCSDASGTLWLDVAKRSWSPAMLAACGLDERAMPRVFEGSEATGGCARRSANAWGVGCVPVAAGAGDQAAGAVGRGRRARGEARRSRSARRASSSSRAIASSRIPLAPCTRSATAYRAAGTRCRCCSRRRAVSRG